MAILGFDEDVAPHRRAGSGLTSSFASMPSASGAGMVLRLVFMALVSAPSRARVYPRSSPLR